MDFCRCYKVDGKAVNTSVQADAWEFFNNIFDELEGKLRPLEQVREGGGRRREEGEREGGEGGMSINTSGQEGRGERREEGEGKGKRRMVLKFLRTNF
jgi:hypothetical protein